MRSSNEEIYLSMGISKTVYDYGCTIEKSLRDRFDEVDSNAEYNQLKVVNAMQQHQVSEACLLGTTGYGYNDLGRDTLEAVYAATFHTEDALVRPQITTIAPCAKKNNSSTSIAPAVFSTILSFRFIFILSLLSHSPAMCQKKFCQCDLSSTKSETASLISSACPVSKCPPLSKEMNVQFGNLATALSVSM